MTIDNLNTEELINQLAIYATLDSDIEQYFRENKNLLFTILEYLETPLSQELPQDIKVFYNEKLQTHLIYQFEFNRYYVEHIPDKEEISHEDIVTQLYLFDGELALFGLEEKTVIKRYSEPLEEQISLYLEGDEV